MSFKRALVVDDSKSARAFLAKVLEDHQLEVDTAETAEQAIDYLTRHRPDVIFMDHLMPGMDGFQAVQAIKSNPNTATIPILMFTSQEGELYLGQARALGAMGVLPKQVAPADVKKVLQQLNLVALPAAAARTEATGEFSTATYPTLESAVIPPGTGVFPVAATGSMPALADTLLRDQIAELRRFMVSSLDDQSERILEDVRVMIREAAPPPVVVPEPVVIPPPRNPWPWAIAAGLATVAAALGALLWNATQQGRELQARLTESQSQFAATLTGVQSLREEVRAAAAPRSSLIVGSDVTIIPVPFGETPLGGNRVDQLRKVVGELAASGRAGTVEVRRFAGRYCLTGDRANGFALAEAATPYPECDLVVDADDAQLTSAPAESLAFANALAELRKAHGPAIRIEVRAGGNTPAMRRYPETSGASKATAGEWNAAADANNRVEIRWQPDA